ncbi:hypothetical protein SBRCBS47491_008821 [Sporothrix bragantina]|uniref:J domain-containing protein n=1 Tax=Sporothrix bragantina TaxID=671064 RepID=A0ABP0CQ70_9PEZI
MLLKLSALTLVVRAVSVLAADDIPSDTPVASLLASAQGHLSRGETSEALVYYDAAIVRDPTDYLTYFKRATTYLSLGRASQATDDFNTVLALRPGFEAAHVQLGKIKQRVADWDGAREQLQQAKGAPEAQDLLATVDDAERAAIAAEAAEAGGNWEECVNQASVAIMVATRAASLRNIRARCRFARGEVEEGVGDLQHVLHLKPGDVSPYLVISAINFYALDDLEKGMSHVRKCLQSDPDSKPCRALLRQEKAVEKTVAKVEKAFSKSQPSTGTMQLISSGENPGLLQEIKDHISILHEQNILPAASPNRLLSRLTSMTCQGYYEMKSKKATSWCEEALQLDEDSLYGLLHKHKVQLDADQFEAAIETLKKAKEAHGEQSDLINKLINEADVLLRRSKIKDYYKVIGVSRDADERQIKSAYRKLSKLHHPDKAVKQGLTKESAEKKMAEINEAYEVLSDPELRARFDRGDDPNSQGQQNPFQGNPFGGQQFMFQQGGGQQFKFQFGSGGGGGGGFPFGR